MIRNVRFKARPIAKGFTKKEGIDYNIFFSPAIKDTVIRVMFNLISYFNWEMELLDVKTSFFHGELKKN